MFKLERGILSQNGETKNVLTIQGKIGEIYPQSPGKRSLFPFQPYFSISFSLKSCPQHPHKSLTSGITSPKLSAHKVWRL